jgi:hypothetical protein
MRPIPNPTQRLVTIFGLVGVIGLLAGAVGFILGDVAIGIVGLVGGGVFVFTVPFLHSSGKKQVKEIEELLSGQGLLARWTYDADEWNRYTANEYSRGMQLTRKLFLWVTLIIISLTLVVGLFGDGMDLTYVVIALAIGIVFGALFGGISYLMTVVAHKANQAGVGEVFIGGTSVYFGNRFYTWKSKWTTLEKVVFEPGNPSVVEFVYRAGGGDQTSHTEVRVPVPRGCEEEAQALVQQFYAAG